MIRSTIPAKEYISQDFRSDGGWIRLSDLRSFVAAMEDWPGDHGVIVLSNGFEATRDLPHRERGEV